MNRSLIAALLAFAALGMAFLVMQQSGRRDAWQAESYVFPTLRDVQRVEIRCAADPIVLERRDADWVLTAPFEYDANDSLVARLVEVFAERRFFDRTRPAADAAAIGTSDGGVALALSAADGTRFEGVLGSLVQPPSGGREMTWLVPQGSATAYRMSTDLRARVRCDPEHWRDLRVLRWMARDVGRIELGEGESRVSFARTEGGWEAPERPTWTLDTNRLDRLAATLAELTGEAIATDVTPDQAGLGPDSPRAVLHHADGRTATLMLGADVPAGEEGAPSSQAYVGVEGLPLVWVVRGPSATRIGEHPADQRQREVFQGDVESLRRLERVDPDGTRLVLERAEASGAWRATSPEVVETLDEGALTRLLGPLAVVRAERWTYGEAELAIGRSMLEGPAQMWTAEAGGGVRWSLRFVQETRDDGRSRVWAQVDGGEPFVMATTIGDSLSTDLAGLRP
jgi:hypothetical protein